MLLVMCFSNNKYPTETYLKQFEFRPLSNFDLLLYFSTKWQQFKPKNTYLDQLYTSTDIFPKVIIDNA